MTNEFKRMAKELKNLIGKSNDQRFENFSWHFETDKNFEKISVKLEIEYFKGHEHYWFYIDKNEMERAEDILNKWMDFEFSLPRELSIPTFTNKRDFMHWFDGREFLEIEIENDENDNSTYHVIFDCYEEELNCIWKGEYEELNKMLNSLCDLYLIHINENV